MNEQNHQADIKKFMDKVKALEKNEKLDLSSDEDLSIGIMNLISIEEHLFFSGGKTGKPEYYDLLNEIREMRKDLLKKIIKEYEGEVWCISKHLLAGSMRLMEVGTKFQGKGDRENAQSMFDKAYKLYSLFWGLNLGLVNIPDTPAGDDMQGDDMNLNFVGESSGQAEADITVEDHSSEKHHAQAPTTKSVSMLEKLGKIVQKAVDCCRE